MYCKCCCIRLCPSAEYSAVATACIGPSALVKADYAIRTLYWRRAEADGGTRENWRVRTLARHVGCVHRAAGPLLRSEWNHGCEKEAICSSNCVWTYNLIRNLAAPKKWAEVEYADLVKLVQDHLTPKPTVIVQRFKFYTRKQRPGEPVAAFMAKLRHLTEHCNSGATLDDMLRDRVVCGIEDVSIQRRLLAEDELTLEKAIQLARALETADKDASALQSPRAPAPAEVHSVNRQQKGPELSPCYRCGGKHKQSDCRFKASVCYGCKKTRTLS